MITHCINIMFLRHKLRDVNIIWWWHHFRSTRVVIVFSSNRGKLSDAGVGILRDRLHSRNLKLLEGYGGHCWCLLETNSMFMAGIVNRRHIHIWLREIGRHLSHAQLIEFARLLIIQFILGLQVHLLHVSIIWERSWVHEVAFSFVVKTSWLNVFRLIVNEHGWNTLGPRLRNREFIRLNLHIWLSCILLLHIVLGIRRFLIREVKSLLLCDATLI